MGRLKIWRILILNDIRMQFIKDSCRMVNDKDWGCWLEILVGFMRDSGSWIRDKELDLRNIKIIIFIKASFLIINHMDKEFFIGLLRGRFMKGNGLWVVSKAMVFGRDLMGIHMLVNGWITRLVAREFIFGKTVTVMKDHGLTA